MGDPHEYEDRHRHRHRHSNEGEGDREQHPAAGIASQTERQIYQERIEIDIE